MIFLVVERLPYKKYENALFQLISNIFSQQRKMIDPLSNDVKVVDALKLSTIHFYNRPEKQKQAIFLDHLACEKEFGDKCLVGKSLLITNDLIKENLNSYFSIKSFKGKTIQSVLNTLTFLTHVLITGKVFIMGLQEIYIDYSVIRSWTDFISVEFRKCLMDEFEDVGHDNFYYNCKILLKQIQKNEPFSIDLASIYA